MQLLETDDAVAVETLAALDIALRLDVRLARLLESAFRLGEAQGLNMAGPLEKPVRLEELEGLLRRLKPVAPL